MLYPVVVTADLIEFHNSNVPVTIMIIPVPPKANPDGIPVKIEITYGKQAMIAKNGAPIQLILFNTRVMCFSVSTPFLTPGMKRPDFSKSSDNFCGLI
jgi:hypothetical protein